MGAKDKKSRFGVDLRTVYELIALTNNVVDKAIITHILSSSMKFEELRKLKVSDLLDACEDAFRDFEDKNSLRVLLQKDPNLITPVWYFKKTNREKNNCCITFSSGESLFYIFVHLKERLNKFNITNEDYLFANEKNNQLNKSHISDNLRKASKKLFGESENQYISVEDLRFYFDDICLSCLPSSEEGNKKLLKLFKEGVSEKAYVNHLENLDDIKEQYQGLLNNLTAKNYENVVYRARLFDIEDSSRKQMDEKVLEYICDKYLDSKFNGSYSEDEEKVMRINFIKYAKTDNKYCLFIDSEEYLTDLWEKTLIQHFLDGNKKINIKITPKTLDKKLNELLDTLDDYGIFDEFLFVTEGSIKYTFKEWIMFELNDKNSINIHSADVAEILHECLLK